MARITWDGVGEKLFETGTDRGVLYIQDKGAYPKGVAWNGLTSVTESPSGADENAFAAFVVLKSSVVRLTAMLTQMSGQSAMALSTLFLESYLDSRRESRSASPIVL